MRGAGETRGKEDRPAKVAPDLPQCRHDEPVKLKLKFASKRGVKRPLLEEQAKEGEEGIDKVASAIGETRAIDARKKRRQAGILRLRISEQRHEKLTGA